MYLRYTHPSACGYDINKAYSLGELKKDLSMDMIKLLFTPIDGTWEKAIPKKTSKFEKFEDVGGEI